MTRTLLALAVATGTVALATSSYAQSPSACTRLDQITKMLNHNFAERPVARGLQEDGTLISVFASEQGKTFTVVIASPDGMGCIVAGGVAWESAPPAGGSLVGAVPYAAPPRHPASWAGIPAEDHATAR